MRAEHINITIPSELREAVDRQAQQERTKRSSLIQKAVRVYLGLSKQKALRALLREGYEAMGPESLRLAREYERLETEALKHVD